jgi:hypothetical protein
MTTIEKVLMGIIAVGMVTTLILPRRQTPAVINAAGSAFSRSLGTAMGRTAAIPR